MLLLNLSAAVSNAGEPQKKQNKRGLLDVAYSDHGGGHSVVPFDLGHGSHGLRAGSESVGTSGIQVNTITRQVLVPVPQPVPVTVNRAVPVAVPVPYAVSVPRPVPVPVPQPVPFTVIRPVPVTIHRPIPVPISQPYTVYFPRAVPVPQPITFATPQYVVMSAGEIFSSGVTGRGFHGGSGIFSGLHGGTIDKFHEESPSLSYGSVYGHSIKG